MNLLRFIEHYPDEASCRAKFKEFREREGVVCPHCGSKEHYWIEGMLQYECKQCKYRQSLRANTVMHESHISFRHWFIAAHLFTYVKESHLMELQQQLEHINCKPVWHLLRRMCTVMGKGDMFLKKA